MSEQVKTIIKETSISEEQKQEMRKELLKKMGICINTQKFLEKRIKKLITSIVIN